MIILLIHATPRGPQGKPSLVMLLSMGVPLTKAWWLGLGRGAMAGVYVADPK